MPSTQTLFEELHQELGYRGLFGAQRRLEAFRRALLDEYAATLVPAATPAVQPAVAAGFPEGSAPVVSAAGQAGLPADAPQPTVPIA